MHACRDRGFGLVDKADEVATAHVDQHGREALPAFADDLDRSVLDLHIGNLREFDGAAIRPHDRHAREIARRRRAVGPRRG